MGQGRNRLFTTDCVCVSVCLQKAARRTSASREGPGHVRAHSFMSEARQRRRVDVPLPWKMYGNAAVWRCAGPSVSLTAISVVQLCFIAPNSGHNDAATLAVSAWSRSIGKHTHSPEIHLYIIVLIFERASLSCVSELRFAL